MKACPFCAELIQDSAIKCRYCGERLDQSTDETSNQSTISTIRSNRNGKVVTWVSDGSPRELLEAIDWAATAAGLPVVGRSFENLSLVFESDKATMSTLGFLGHDTITVMLSQLGKGAQAVFNARKKPVGIQRSQPTMNADRYSDRLLAVLSKRFVVEQR